MNKRRYELTFWGTVTVPHKRYHETSLAARVEAERVLALLENRAAHPAIIYDCRTNEQLYSVM